VCRLDFTQQSPEAESFLVADLLHLQLSGEGFVFTSPEPLVYLQSLPINYETLDDLGHLLDPVGLPSLRSLGLEFITERDELEVLETTQLAKLLPQLDAIVVRAELYKLAHASLFAGLSDRILVDSWLERLGDHRDSLSTVHHLRLIPEHLDYKAVQKLSTFVASLPNSTPQHSHALRSIYLDPTFWRTSDTTEEVRQAIDRVTSNCRQKGIEVVYEIGASDTWVDSYISQEFWRRQREERQRTAQE
jgi:hypothetical protein